MKEETGGLAFPSTRSVDMTLRDWFAGMALQGVIAYPHKESAAAIANSAYAIADAMLKARGGDDLLNKGEKE